MWLEPTLLPCVSTEFDVKGTGQNGRSLSWEKEASMQYLVVGRHPPDLCPASNETIRNLAREGGDQMPALAEKLGVKILATYVPMTNHMVVVAVEADDADSVRELAFQGRLSQWNSVEIYQTSTLEEALNRVQELPTIY